MIYTIWADKYESFVVRYLEGPGDADLPSLFAQWRARYYQHPWPECGCFFLADETACDEATRRDTLSWKEFGYDIDALYPPEMEDGTLYYTKPDRSFAAIAFAQWLIATQGFTVHPDVESFNISYALDELTREEETCPSGL